MTDQPESTIFNTLDTAEGQPVVERTTIAHLVPDPQNANAGTEEGEQLLKSSLEDLGAGRSILIDRNGVIIAGNKTAGQAAAAGIRDVLVVETDGSQLVAVRRTDLDLRTDARAKRLALADNRVAQLDLAWDEEALAAIAAQAPEALEGLWTVQEIAALLAEEPETQAPAGDRPADTKVELQAKYGTELGQLWRLGEHRMLIADSTDPANLLRLTGPDQQADMVFTDPPYGVSYESDVQGSIQNDAHRGDQLAQFLLPLLRNAKNAAKDTAAFYIWHATSTRRDFEYALDHAGLRELQYITWIKDSFVLGRSDYHWQTEPCFYAAKDGSRPTWYGDRTQSNVWRASIRSSDGAAVSLSTWLHLSDGRGSSIWIRNKAPKNIKSRHLRLEPGERIQLIPSDQDTDAWEITRDPVGTYIHPTQKPAALAEKAITNSSRIGDLVLDVCLGSGSTLIGAERSRRRCYGLELDPLFAAAILERFYTETGLTPERLE